MFYVHDWWHRSAEKSLPGSPDAVEEGAVSSAVVVFLHSEANDEKDRGGVLRKSVKNIKWIAGKFDTGNVVLHSFNHLSSSKSSPEFAGSLFEDIRGRLENSGYRVMRTPFGYFNEFRMHVAGDSLAKVFKEF